MGTFKQARREEIERIPWLGGNERGIGLAEALGASQDTETDLLKDTLLIACGPYTCHNDALDLIGNDMQIERFAGESNGTAPDPTTGEGGSGYRGRLCAAWATWEKAGTELAIVDSLKAYGFLDVAVYEDFEGHWFLGDWYSRFLVVIGPDFGRILGIDGAPLAPLIAPFFTPATGGSTASSAQILAVVRQILKWKSAHSYPVKVILRFGGAILSNINSTAPFTPPDPTYWCAWDVGKLAVENIETAPFTPGGFFFTSL